MRQEAVRQTGGGVEVRVHVQPNASKVGFSGVYGDRLRLRVAAPPVEGAANKAVVEYLARVAGVPRSAVVLLRGDTSRDKDLRIESPDPTGVAGRLRAAGGI